MGEDHAVGMGQAAAATERQNKGHFPRELQTYTRAVRPAHNVRVHLAYPIQIAVNQFGVNRLTAGVVAKEVLLLNGHCHPV